MCSIRRLRLLPRPASAIASPLGVAQIELWSFVEVEHADAVEVAIEAPRLEPDQRQRVEGGRSDGVDGKGVLAIGCRELDTERDLTGGEGEGGRGVARVELAIASRLDLAGERWSMVALDPASIVSNVERSTARPATTT